MMSNRTVNMEIKKVVCDSVILSILTYASATWTWNKPQRFRNQPVEVSYLRGVCGLNRMDIVNNESVYGKFGISFINEEMRNELRNG